jgi:hypothetical protein
MASKQREKSYLVKPTFLYTNSLAVKTNRLHDACEDAVCYPSLDHSEAVYQRILHVNHSILESRCAQGEGCIDIKTGVSPELGLLFHLLYFLALFLFFFIFFLFLLTFYTTDHVLDLDIDLASITENVLRPYASFNIRSRWKKGYGYTPYLDKLWSEHQTYYPNCTAYTLA